MLRRLGWMLSRNDKTPDIWNTHDTSGNVFVNPPASSSSPYPGGFNPWIPNVTEHISPHATSERQITNTTSDPRCQSGPSCRNSFDPKEGRLSKVYEADQQRLQISDLHFDQFYTPTTFACWKIRFQTAVCTCSQFLAEAMLWIKEVEMVESMDDFKSSRSLTGTHEPNFELLDARIASALNKIIQNTRFKKRSVWRNKKPKKDDRFLRGRWIAHLIYEYFRVTAANDPVENYADLFTVVLRNDDIKEFDSKWDEILLSMTQIPSDDKLESLYKLRIRESEKLKTILELYNMEIHQKKAGPDYHRLKTMVKRSIEQNPRIKNFEARNGNFEKNAVLKNHSAKQREQRCLGYCWQWKANGQCSKGDYCSFRHGTNKRAKSTQPNHSPRSSSQHSMKNASRTRSPRGRIPSGRMARLPCKDSSKELAPLLHSVKNDILQNACSASPKMEAGSVKSALMRIARLMNSRAKGLKKEWCQKCSGHVENYTTIGLRIPRYAAAEVSNDFAEELKYTEANPMCSIH